LLIKLIGIIKNIDSNYRDHLNDDDRKSSQQKLKNRVWFITYS